MMAAFVYEEYTTIAVVVMPAFFYEEYITIVAVMMEAASSIYEAHIP